MPEVRAERSVGRSLHEVWPIIEDLDAWAPCMPGYVSHHRIDDELSEWTLRGDLGPFSRTVKVAVRITEWTEPNRVAFTLEGIDEAVHGEGVFELSENSEAEDLPVPDERPWWRRLLLWLFGGTPEAPSAPAGDGTTHVVFTFSIAALGPMGPMIDALLGPWSEVVAERLLNDVAVLVESA